MPTTDLYSVLGIGRQASADEIRKAYRALARRYHPDVSSATDADARMKEINAAYAVLADPKARAAYDLELARAERPVEHDRNFGFSGDGHDIGAAFPGDFNDGFPEFLGQIFSRYSGLRSRSKRRGATVDPTRDPSGTRGRDLSARIELDLEDAFFGAVRPVRLQMPRIDAQGLLDVSTRTLEVYIPAGAHDGQRIRLAGQGSPGNGDGPPGDLLLEVSLRPHPRFRIDGRNLHSRLSVAPWEAALGAVVPMETPAGPLKIRVPAGAQGGTELRVRGRGIPGSPPGDLYLDVQIVVPSADSPAARSAYEQLAAACREGFEANRRKATQGSSR